MSEKESIVGTGPYWEPSLTFSLLFPESEYLYYIASGLDLIGVN